MDLQLFESNAKPHLYWFAAKYLKKKGDSMPSFFRCSQTPGLFDREFAHFRFFFHKKTGITWDERLIKAGAMGERYFRYDPPVSVR